MEDMAKILCVDDEQNVLDALVRVLFDDYDVDIATGGPQALELMANNDYAVIISDMRMPEMNGAQFLAQARKIAPNTTRMLLTGHSDIESAMMAINEGNIFRFLIKPCPEDKLIGHINDAVRMHRLVQMEKELLNKTLMGTVNVLTEILSIVAPEAFSRSNHIKALVSHICKETSQEDAWQYEIAALLSQVGCIVLPPQVMEKAFSNLPLSNDEKTMMASTPLSGSKLIAAIPRLEKVSTIIKYQNMTAEQGLGKLPHVIATGVRMLRIAINVDRLCAREQISITKAVKTLRQALTDPKEITLTDALLSFDKGDSKSAIKALHIKELDAGMVLDEDVTANNGGLVLRKGQQLTTPLIERLLNFASRVGVKEPINVIVAE